MNFAIKVFQLYRDRFDFFSNLFIEHIIISFTAIIITTAIGIILGIYITRDKKAANIVLSVANFLYTIPSIALLGFLVALVGIGTNSALIALVIYGILPMLRSTYVGIMEVDKQIIDVALAMGSTDFQLLTKIQLPLALPVIISGFRTMVVMTIALGCIASFIGAGGLGVAIWRGITTNFSEMTVAGSLLVAVLALGSDLLIEVAEKKISNKIIMEKRNEKIRV